MFIEECLDGKKILRYTFKDDDTVDTVSLGMITNAVIPGICGCHLYSIDGQNTLIYDLSDKTSLSACLESGTSFGGLRGFAEGFETAVASAADYLIPECELVCNPDYFYTDKNGQGCVLCLPVITDGRDTSMNDFMSAMCGVISGYDTYSVLHTRIRDAIYGRRSMDMSELFDEKAEEPTVDESENEQAEITPHEPVSSEASSVRDAPQSGDPVRLFLKKLSPVSFGSFAGSVKKRRKGTPAPSEDCSDLFPQGSYIVRHNTGGTVSIDKNRFSIGKDPSRTDYTVDGNPAVSRMHAEIRYRDGGYYITDCGSTNHTFVDGKNIGSGCDVPLKNGTVIRLADEDFTFYTG